MRKLLARLALVALAPVVVLLLAEATFRAFPRLLPKGSYGTGRYHPELRANVHGGTQIYNKVGFQLRSPNPDGFMDVAHERRAAPGVERIGFFGDSYVESLQVPLEDAFFRRLEGALDGRAETLAFGVSGWGTLHAMRAWQLFGRRYDVDRVVYVFVENDPGDHLQSLRNPGRLPFFWGPLISPGRVAGSYDVHWPLPPEEGSLARRVAKASQRNSRVAQLTFQRLFAMASPGGGQGAAADQVEMARRTRPGTRPNSNDLAGSWPEPFAEEARTLGSFVLRDWAKQVRLEGKTFSVLYVPRGEAYLRGEIAERDVWRPWLLATCAELGIEVLDPSDALRRTMEEGRPVYRDHWTSAGHETIARFLAESPVARGL